MEVGLGIDATGRPTTAVLYGLSLAAIFSILILAFEITAGIALFALILGLYLVLTGWIPWARLGMALTTVGMSGAGVGLIVLGGFLLLHQDMVSRSPEHLIPLLVVILAAPLLLWIDSRVHREAWRRWEQAMRRASLPELLTGRHLPSGK